MTGPSAANASFNTPSNSSGVLTRRPNARNFPHISQDQHHQTL